MEMSYQEAMVQLKSMFENFDDETIRTVLASNDGHLEKTIDDLVKLTEEVEKVPDDENLFAEPSPNQNRFGGNHYDFAARNTQEDEDAKMAYELQRQYMQEEQRTGNNAGNRYNNNRSSVSRAEVQSESSHHPSNRFDYSESGNANTGSQNVVYAHPSHTEKKPNFMKKVKIGLQNLFKGKGKIFRKGSKDQGYQEFEKYEPAQERLYPASNNYGQEAGAQYEEDESPMKLSEVLENQGINKGEIKRYDRDERLDDDDNYGRNDESPVYKQADMRKDNIRKYNDYAASSRQNEMVSPNHFSYDN